MLTYKSLRTMQKKQFNFTQKTKLHIIQFGLWLKSCHTVVKAICLALEISQFELDWFNYGWTPLQITKITHYDCMATSIPSQVTFIHRKTQWIFTLKSICCGCVVIHYENIARWWCVCVHAHSGYNSIVMIFMCVYVNFHKWT